MPASRPLPAVPDAGARDALDAASEARGRVDPASRARAVLIAGGPGAGKTQALAERVRVVLDEGASAERLLAIGFSDGSAAALRDRLARVLPAGLAGPEVLTPARFAASLLRAQPQRAGVDPFFLLATRADRLALLLESRGHELSGAGWNPARPELDAALAELDAIDRVKAAGRSSGSEALELCSEHDRLLAARGALDHGELMLRAASLAEDPECAAVMRARYSHLMVDDFVPVGTPGRLVAALAKALGDVTVAGAPDSVEALELRVSGPERISLSGSRRSAPEIGALTDALYGAARAKVATGDGAVVEEPAAREPPAGEVGAGAGRLQGETARGSAVRFWRARDERSQAMAIAVDVERTVGSWEHAQAARQGAGSAAEGVATRGEEAIEAARAPSIAIVTASVEREGQALAGALRARGVPFRIRGAGVFFESAEVRDLLAWLRLLADPLDANAAVRLLVRAPIALRPQELARVGQLARRRRLDMLSALSAAVEAPKLLAPETRERVAAFVELHRELAEAVEQLSPEQLVRAVIDRSGLRRSRLLSTSAGALESQLSLSRIEALAAHFTRMWPGASARELARYLTAAADAGLELEPPAGESDWPRGGEDVGVADDGRAVVEITAASGLAGRQVDEIYVVGVGVPALGSVSSVARGGRAGPAPAEDALDGAVAVAIARARRRVVLTYAAGDESGATYAPHPSVEAARRALGAPWEDEPSGELGAEETLLGALRVLRERVLEDVTRIAGRLGELRLDTDYDIARGVAGYLDLLKVAALAQGQPGRSLEEALADLNARLGGAASPLQRELFEASRLDEAIRGGGEEGLAADASAGAPASWPYAAASDDADQHLLRSLLPRHGQGLTLSASDIETYRACPLRYKFGRLLRIPVEPTPQQRFGIVVHQVLERYHSGRGATAQAPAEAVPGALLRLLEAAWRRAGFGGDERDAEWLEKARAALVAYHRQLADHEGTPVWFERSFSFRVGPHLIRGRVDRVDRLPDGGYELIDYKTGHPRSSAQLAGDIQLPLYALAARRAWGIRASRQSYYYILDCLKVPLPDQPEDERLRGIGEAVEEVGEGILQLRFDAQPSYAVCSSCDYLSICPAAET